MVRLVVTQTLLNAVKEASALPEASGDLLSALTPYLGASDLTASDDVPSTIDHQTVVQVSKALQASEGKDSSEYSLHALLRGSKVYMDRPKERVKSPELVRILENIKADLANKEYAEMVRHVSTFRERDNVPASSIGNDLRDAFRQMTAIINVIFSILAVFMAVYWVSGTVTRDIGMKVLISLFFALVALIAEGWFFTRDWLLNDIAPASTTPTRGTAGKQ
ncbi:endoplasmic reticulum-based factor for assembly of V-ATPase-domain-containing protein [Gaertneriomyces semiglobifer]|nr:endoplasmic reticulum-based factor for assembly of V-ATPase-domain-containing protein [Gaertneriomyces semiglobifer]